MMIILYQYVALSIRYLFTKIFSKTVENKSVQTDEEEILLFHEIQENTNTFKRSSKNRKPLKMYNTNSDSDSDELTLTGEFSPKKNIQQVAFDPVQTTSIKSSFGRGKVNFGQIRKTLGNTKAQNVEPQQQSTADSSATFSPPQNIKRPNSGSQFASMCGAGNYQPVGRGILRHAVDANMPGSTASTGNVPVDVTRSIFEAQRDKSDFRIASENVTSLTTNAVPLDKSQSGAYIRRHTQDSAIAAENVCSSVANNVSVDKLSRASLGNDDPDPKIISNTDMERYSHNNEETTCTDMLENIEGGSGREAGQASVLFTVPDEGTSTGKVDYDDDIVEWDTAESQEPYIFKQKKTTFCPPDMPGTSIISQPEPMIDFQKIRQSNLDVSSTWLAKTLAKKSTQPSHSEMQQILDLVEQNWFNDACKNRSNLVQFLRTEFSRSVNPFVLAGFIIDKSRDSHMAKTTTLSFFVMKEFDKWFKHNKSRISPESYLSVDLQLQIYEICTRNHMTMLDMAVRCFQLNYLGNDHFLPVVRRFLDKKKYKEASVCIGKLGLQHHFTMEEVGVTGICRPTTPT